MDATTESVDPTQAAVEAELSQLEKAEGITPPPAPAEASATDEQTAPVPETEANPQETAEPTADADTPATAELPAPGPEKTTTEVKEPKSKFAKDQERRDRSWKALEAEKAAERAKLQAERAALEAEKAEFNKQKPAPITPERYRATAESWEAKAALLEKRAAAAEDAGKYEDAEKLREEAAELNLDARRARRTADQVEKASPADLVQNQAQVEAGRKEWYAKAQIDFPNAAKPGTPEAQALQALIAENPDIALPENASQMYWACRLVTGEAAAARVPTLTKLVSELTAKNKELEAKLNISTDSTMNPTRGEVPFEQLSAKEQEAWLERESRALSQSRY